MLRDLSFLPFPSLPFFLGLMQKLRQMMKLKAELATVSNWFTLTTYNSHCKRRRQKGGERKKGSQKIVGKSEIGNWTFCSTVVALLVENEICSVRTVYKCQAELCLENVLCFKVPNVMQREKEVIMQLAIRSFEFTYNCLSKKLPLSPFSTYQLSKL